LYLLDIVIRDFQANKSVFNRWHQLNTVQKIGSEIVRELRFTRDRRDVNAELFSNEKWTSLTERHSFKGGDC
jgi:hypothetical protein